MHPDELLEQLKKTANTRKQKNLDIIHAVCREQYERGSKDFSVATIARIAEERGGPVKGSIHNKTGDDFKGLIKAWAQHTGGVTRKVRQVSQNPYEALIDRIEQPEIRSIMASVLAENRKLRAQNNLLKSQEHRVIDMRPQTQTPVRDPIQVLPGAKGLLSDWEIEALSRAVSQAFLDQEGWSEGANGIVLNASGRKIYAEGYMSGIRKIIGET